jgi:hypothetical protein
MAVGQVGGPSNDTQTQPKSEDLGQVKAQQVKLDDANIAQTSDKQRELLGAQDAARFNMQQQAMQAQQVGGQNQNAFDAATPEVQGAANDVAKRVMAKLMRSINQVTESANAQSSGDAGSDSFSGNGTAPTGATGASSGPGAMSANQVGDQEDQANQQIQDAAKVAVYRDITTQITGMQDRLNQKNSLRDAESAINAVLARAKPGDKVKIPNYVMGEDGKVTQKGTVECTYEEAQQKRDSLKDQRDSISDMSEMDTLQLQSLMEKKGQLESMISNEMKAIGDVQNNLAGALKA